MMKTMTRTIGQLATAWMPNSNSVGSNWFCGRPARIIVVPGRVRMIGSVTVVE